ncbi:hypothetical protein Tco_0542815, partial [Tanacetum coccineum]
MRNRLGNQREVVVAGNRETVRNQVVQQTRIKCYNSNGFGHMAKECRLAKWVKDYAYRKENMLMCKKEEVRVHLSAIQHDWLHDSDKEHDDQE